jgi:hypothetical protein
MKIDIRSTVPWTAWLAATSLLLILGCANPAKIRPREIRIGLPSSLGPVDVEVAGVSAGDIETWMGLNVNEYFDSKVNALRNAAAANGLLLSLNGKDSNRLVNNEFVIDKGDPVWTDWRAKGVRYLVIIANLDRRDLSAGGYDPRRKKVDLTQALAGKRQIISVLPNAITERAEK